VVCWVNDSDESMATTFVVSDDESKAFYTCLPADPVYESALSAFLADAEIEEQEISQEETIVHSTVTVELDSPQEKSDLPEPTCGENFPMESFFSEFSEPDWFASLFTLDKLPSGKDRKRDIQPLLWISLNGNPCLAELDSGASHCFLSKQLVLDLGLSIEFVKGSCSKQIQTAGGIIPTVGYVTALVRWKYGKVVFRFTVLERHDNLCLLGRDFQRFSTIFPIPHQEGWSQSDDRDILEPFAKRDAPFHPSLLGAEVNDLSTRGVGRGVKGNRLGHRVDPQRFPPPQRGRGLPLSQAHVYVNDIDMKFQDLRYLDWQPSELMTIVAKRQLCAKGIQKSLRYTVSQLDTCVKLDSRKLRASSMQTMLDSIICKDFKHIKNLTNALDEFQKREDELSEGDSSHALYSGHPEFPTIFQNNFGNPFEYPARIFYPSPHEGYAPAHWSRAIQALIINQCIADEKSAISVRPLINKRKDDSFPDKIPGSV